MTFDPDEIVRNAQAGTGPCAGCPAQADTQGRFVNPGLLNPSAELMALTMDPSHQTDWGAYDNWAAYNAETAEKFRNHWPGGTALSKLLAPIPGISIDDIWLGDAVKCPVNNDLAGAIDLDDVFAHCSSYLGDEIETVDPRVIVTMGNDPAEQLLSGVFDIDVGSISAGTDDCGRIVRSSPPVVISPHWGHGWLRRNDNRPTVQRAIAEVLGVQLHENAQASKDDDALPSAQPSPPSPSEQQADRSHSDGDTATPNVQGTHGIPKDTWRGYVASVLDSDTWMDAHQVSNRVTAAPDIPKTLSKGGASSVLSDMRRHDDVVRRESSSGPTQYEYQLRDDAVLE